MSASNDRADCQAISVAVRVRPLNERELSQGHKSVWKPLTKFNSIAQTTSEGQPLPERISNHNFFTYDRVFDELAGTADVYDAIGRNIILGVMRGINGTIFAYGQTSSGKTHTMYGSEDNPGVFLLATQDILKEVQENPSREFLLRVSFVEIYNETVRDLLSTDESSSMVNIREDPKRGVFLETNEKLADNLESFLDILKTGERNRRTESTALNMFSSRSHTIFRVVVESRSRVDSDSSPILVSCLNLVDLAGSESVRSTGNTGQKAKEGGKINQSLLSLSRVIVALSSVSDSNGVPSQHVGYRDSKLTRILQPSLSGDAQMSIVCCITPADGVFSEETKSTLQFASRAKLVKTRAKVNEIMMFDDETNDSDERVLMIRRLRCKNTELEEEIERLKQELSFDDAKLKRKLDTSVTSVDIQLNDSYEFEKKKKSRPSNCEEMIILRLEVEAAKESSEIQEKRIQELELALKEESDVRLSQMTELTNKNDKGEVSLKDAMLEIELMQQLEKENTNANQELLAEMEAAITRLSDDNIDKEDKISELEDKLRLREEELIQGLSVENTSATQQLMTAKDEEWQEKLRLREEELIQGLSVENTSATQQLMAAKDEEWQEKLRILEVDCVSEIESREALFASLSADLLSSQDLLVCKTSEFAATKIVLDSDVQSHLSRCICLEKAVEDLTSQNALFQSRVTEAEENVNVKILQLADYEKNSCAEQRLIMSAANTEMNKLKADITKLHQEADVKNARIVKLEAAKLTVDQMEKIRAVVKEKQALTERSEKLSTELNDINEMNSQLQIRLAELENERAQSINMLLLAMKLPSTDESRSIHSLVSDIIEMAKVSRNMTENRQTDMQFLERENLDLMIEVKKLKKSKPSLAFDDQGLRDENIMGLQHPSSAGGKIGPSRGENRMPEQASVARINGDEEPAECKQS